MDRDNLLGRSVLSHVDLAGWFLLPDNFLFP